MVPDENSMEDPLCNSSFGSMVSLDYVTPDTSIVLGEVKAETPVHDEDPRNDQIIWQQYIQQIESLSPENRLSKFCKEAGFMRVVEVEQYFVTKNTGDFRQFQSVACREYTLPRDDQASQPKGWIQGNMRIGPVLEVTTSFQHFKYGIETRIKSVNQDDSHSWVRISYGTVKYVTDSIKDNTENPADPQEEESPQTSTSVVAARSKAKAKPQPRVLVGTTATIPIHQRIWIDIVPSKQDLDSYDLSKKVINLLRHNQTLHREGDGAIEFCKIKFHLRNHHSQIQNWSDDRWKACLAAGGGSKRRYQYCSDYLGTIIYLRVLQGHSGNNLIDPTLQDNVLFGPGIFPYIYHVGCTFNLYSIISNGLVPGGQNLSRRQCSSCLLIQEMKVTETLNVLTSLYHVSHDTCTKHGRDIKTRYFGSILILESRKDWCSIKQDRMQLFFKEHFQPIVL